MSFTPATDGFFGPYGGQFVPEGLKTALDELDRAFQDAQQDPEFLNDFSYYLNYYAGRPSPLYFCANLSRRLGGAKVYIKREDLNHLGAHKINNTLGQILLARKMGKKKVIAETGAGQHGVATAATAALMDMECTIYMGEEDIRRQELNVFRMQMMGAEVVPTTFGQRTLKEAVDQAIDAWVKELDHSHYLLGSAVGPHPYPGMVRYFQEVIGSETKEQILDLEGRLPDHVLACVGGGSNAIGIFSAFLEHQGVNLEGIEPAGRSLDYGDHAATLTLGTPGTMHGFHSYMLQDQAGEPAPVYSVSAGLDYPSVGPEHSLLKDSGRVTYLLASDQQALEAFFLLSKTEGIIPALESSHALARAIELAPTLSKDEIIIVNLSGRGDKDVSEVKHITDKAKG